MGHRVARGRGRPVSASGGMAWGAEIAEMVATTAAQRMALKPTSSRQCSQLQRAQQPVWARKLSQSDLLSAIAGGVCDKPPTALFGHGVWRATTFVSAPVVLCLCIVDSYYWMCVCARARGRCVCPLSTGAPPLSLTAQQPSKHDARVLGAWLECGGQCIRACSENGCRQPQNERLLDALSAVPQAP